MHSLSTKKCLSAWFRLYLWVLLYFYLFVFLSPEKISLWTSFLRNPLNLCLDPFSPCPLEDQKMDYAFPAQLLKSSLQTYRHSRFNFHPMLTQKNTYLLKLVPYHEILLFKLSKKMSICSRMMLVFKLCF